MAFDFFLQLDGIKGESQDDKHKDEIDVIEWRWGMTQSATFQMGGGGASGKVNVQDIELHKFVDASTTALQLHTASGKHIPKGKLTIRKSGGDAPVDYYVMEFELIFVSSYEVIGAENDPLERIRERLTLNFARYKTTYTVQTEQGIAGASSSSGWDIAKNVKNG